MSTGVFRTLNHIRDMKIGLVGESPNDTVAVRNLLSKRYDTVDYITMINDIHGSMLDNKKAIRRILRIEYEDHSPDLIIFIRDLDALEINRTAKRKRQETFSYCNSIVDHIGISLLNIYELEALILANIGAFNAYYGCNHPVVANVMKVVEPKEVLINAAQTAGKKFDESDTPVIFDLLDFDTVMDNCRYFTVFIRKLNRAISDN